MIVTETHIHIGRMSFNKQPTETKETNRWNGEKKAPISKAAENKSDMEPVKIVRTAAA